MAKKNKTVAWKIEYAIYRIVETLFSVLPLSLCYRIGSITGLLSRFVIPKRRVAVERNLRIAFGDTKTADELQELSKEVFRRSGGNLLASIKTATMSLDAIKKCLTIEGAEQIQDFVKENNGAILLLPHMGNWEVGTRLSEIVHNELVGADLAGMYRPLDNPHLDKLVKNRRELSGSILFARNDGMAAPLQFIRDHGVLTILADQRVGKTGQLTPFFGRLTSFSPLPQIYKKRTKCGLMGLAIVTTAPGKWKIKYTFEACKKTDINTGDVAQIMEKLMLLSPADCFWLQDRWRIERRPLHIQGKTPIIKSQLFKSAFKKQHIGMYIEQLTEKHLPALEALARHRPDILLTCYSPEKPAISSTHFKQVLCPNISSENALIEFFEKQDSITFTDILFLPNTFSKLHFETILTQIHLFDYSDLAQSLHAAGLPEQPYS